MKPDVGVSDPSSVDEADVDPCELFVAIGMLVLESRLPTPSVKGRRDGPHCPPALGHWAAHECDPTQPQCDRATRVQKQMQMLWRNRIPMCIEVLLFSDCNHGQHRASTTDITPPDISDSCVLLEQWTIQNVAKKASDASHSARCLFQAVRSYLHFSQLSAWLNATHGTAPQCIGYRVSPPGEFCTSRFSVTPELHVFPPAMAGKTGSLRAMVQLLPRRPDIPKPVCREPHEMSEPLPAPCVHSDALSQKCSHRKSPELEERARSSSPRFTKPNVLNHVLQPHYLNTVTSAACMCAECSTTAVQRSSASSVVSEQPCLLLSSELPCGSHALASNGCPEPDSAKNLGAIPKRLELPVKSVLEDVDCASTLKQDNSSLYASSSKISSHNSLTSAVNHRSTTTSVKEAYYASRRHSMPQKDGTDSDSSSPDIDAYLTQTLANSRLEPLSPQEMEVYLSNLYPQRMHKFKSVGAALKSKSVELNARVSTEPRCRQKSYPQKLENGADGFALETRLDRTAYRSPSSNEYSVMDCDMRGSDECYDTFIDGVNCNQTTLCNRMYDMTIKEDCVFEDGCQKGGQQSLTGMARKQENGFQSKCSNEHSRRLFNCDSDPLHAKFVVGSDNDLVDEANVRSGVGHNSSSLSSGSVSNGCKPKTQPSNVALHKSVSCPNKKAFGANLPCFQKANSLLKTVMKKELHAASVAENRGNVTCSQPVPSSQEVTSFRQNLQKSTNMMFHSSTGLPLQSSPAPIKRASSNSFDYDGTLTSVRSIKNSISCVNLDNRGLENGSADHVTRRTYSTSAPATTNCLLGNFEESMLNGRIEPTGVVEGFTVDIGASGSFCPKHVTLPVTAFFFSLSDDNAPSPYLGHISLDSLPRRGYHVPSKGTVQVTLFNPNKTVVKMFIVVYDLSDMPPNSQTFLRQRTLYMPVKGSVSDAPNVMVYLRYLIHLRFASSKSGKIYLHTDIRVIFARDKFELDSRVANYELRSFTEGPENPKYAPKK